MKIEYTSPNGYRGVLHETSSMSIYDSNGTEVLHTDSKAVNNLEELKVVEQMPELSKQLDKLLSAAESNRCVVSIVR